MNIECNHCGSTIHVTADETSGEFAKCPSCGGVLAALQATILNFKSQIVAHFRLTHLLGEGQFGQVWRARDSRLHRDVALKIPKREANKSERESFLREARAVALLEHPNIVPVYEADESQDHVYISSRLIDGITLKDHLKSNGDRLQPLEAAVLIAKIADGVHHAHDREIVHRDLKPGNILIDQDGEPHVTDFGLAKWLSPDATASEGGILRGTPVYMSPEQSRGENIGPQSDVFALGVILFESLTGQWPFSAEDSSLFQRIQFQSPPKPRALAPTIPRDLETICLKALEKDLKDRYQSAEELSLDLSRFVNGDPISARRPNVAERGWKWMRRNRSLAAALFACMMLLGMVVFRPEKTMPSGEPPTKELGRAPSARENPSEKNPEPLKVHVQTDQPARIAIYHRDLIGGKLRSVGVYKTVMPGTDDIPDKASPAIAEVSLLPGRYFIVAAKDENTFHEVYRTVPQDYPQMPDGIWPHMSWTLEHQKIVWPKIRLWNQADVVNGREGLIKPMVRLPGTDALRIDSNHLIAKVQPYFLDMHEVSVEQYVKIRKGPPPSRMNGHAPQVGTEANPLTQIFWDEAVAYAEAIGARIPTELEYYYAATNGGKTKYPWGNSSPTELLWQPSPADIPRGVNGKAADMTDLGIVGLFSNAAEYVDANSEHFQFSKATLDVARRQRFQVVTIRGGDGEVTMKKSRIADIGPEFRQIVYIGRPNAPKLNVGFRCARSAKPMTAR